MDVPELVMAHVRHLVPATLLAEIASFCITPAFPNWPNKPDIVIATSRGELIEILDRRPTGTCLFQPDTKAEDLLIHYVRDGRPNYVVRCADKVYVVGYRGELKVIAKFEDVAKFEMLDLDLSGYAKLNIWCFDDVIPMVLNEDYEIDVVEDGDVTEDQGVVSVMLGKLSVARLNTARNRKVLDDKKEVRKKVSHAMAEDLRCDLDVIEKNSAAPIFDRIVIGEIWQRVHDKKWIIGVPAENISEKPVENVEILFKSMCSSVFIYETAIFEQDNKASFNWKKYYSKSLESKKIIILVMIMEEPKFDKKSYTILEGAFKYKYDNKEFLLPLKNIQLKASDIINGSFDPILMNSNKDTNDILALYSLSVVTTLNLHFLSEPTNSLVDILKHKLEYISKFDNFPNILCHSKSSLHILHGTALSIIKTNENNLENEITVMSRSEDQLLMFVNIMYDLIPTRMLIVPSEYSIELKNVQSQKPRTMLDTFTDEMDVTQVMNPDERYATDKLASILYTQMSLVIEYLERCIDDMIDVKIIEEKNKNETSMNINILQMGIDSFKQFWNTLDEQNILKKKYYQ